MEYERPTQSKTKTQTTLVIVTDSEPNTHHIGEERMNNERAEKLMNIDRRLASLGDDMVAAVHAGDIFKVEHICIEMDHLRELRKETMELNPLKITYG